MADYPYNPFNKVLSDVGGEDLQVLRTVAEGWYIDYKRELLNIRDLAKALSAFANQYGGFLFIGIHEAGDGSRMAGEFPGLLETEVAAASLRVREAATAHASPAVFYEERVVVGPCAEIGLPAGRAILVIGIPQGMDPPYVHSSGRIYRRLADQSMPKEETDRHVLDLLWDRGRRFRTRLAQLIRRTPELPAAQAESTWVFIHLVPDVRFPSPEALLSFETFRRFASDPQEKMTGVRAILDAVQSRDLGYVGRQVARNKPGLANLSYHWLGGGIARLDLPVNTWKPDQQVIVDRGYGQLRDFLDELQRQRFDPQTVICDFSMLVQGLAALSNLDAHLRRAVADNRPLYAAFEIRNVLYKVPFFNSPAYVERCASYGVPIITERTIVFPPEPSFDTMLQMSGNSAETEDERKSAPYMMTLPLVVMMLNAVGILPDIEIFNKDLELWANHGAQPEPPASGGQ